MDGVSPLTRQFQDSFQPKIVQLYSRLFRHEDQDPEDTLLPSEGYWRELFLLKPDKQKFYDVLESLTADDLLRLRRQTRTFVRRAVSEAGSGVQPQNENALENLTAFMAAVLNKKYTTPSTDVIEVLAGLDSVDRTMSDLVNGLEAVIRQSNNQRFRQKAVETALAMVCGAYQTSLVAYFMHKDFFHGLLSYGKVSSEDTESALDLLGVLANYNKFEAQNIYQNRMEDFVNEDTMAQFVHGLAQSCMRIRQDYISIQDDVPEPWTVTSTLSYVGLRALTPEAKKPLPPTEEEAKILFGALPSANSIALLSIYSFAQANKLFASRLLTTIAVNGSDSPISAFLSITSYLTQHAYRSDRALHYTLLCLLTVRIFTSSTSNVKRLASADHTTTIRLARQRSPHLPHITAPRIPLSAILDILTSTITHNLRLRLSLPLYNLSLTILHSIITQLDTARTRLPHHWSYTWLSLLNLLKFLAQHSTELIKFHRVSDLRSQICRPLTSILTFSLMRGDNFLPDSTSYDDLFYKLLELSDTVLPRFTSAYVPSTLPATDKLFRATKAIISITSHYQTLLKSKKKKQHHDAAEIQTLITEGYDALPAVMDDAVAGAGEVKSGRALPHEEFGHYQPWRESEWKLEIKRILRTVTEDGRIVALQSR